MVMLSGQASIDQDGQIIGSGDFDAQAAQTFANIERVLDAAGSSMDQIVKVTIYLTDMSNFPKILELRERHFSPPYPADTIVEVSALGLPELMIEVEVTALVDGKTVG
jgi:2-iminobutanoate/2-iminopropanoate deaminase